MIGVGLVEPVPEQMSKEMQEFCVQKYVDGRIVGLLGLHGLGRRRSHQEQCPVASAVRLHSGDDSFPRPPRGRASATLFAQRRAMLLQ